MKTIHIFFIFFLVSILSLWLLTDTAQATTTDFWSIRKFILIGSGLLATSVMSIAMLLAIRHLFPDSFLDGLDKRYRLHKWFGIAALVLAITHWLSKESAKWLIELGMLTKPVKKQAADIAQNGFVELVTTQKHLAKYIGEYAFYTFTVLCLLMLIKKVPYQRARQSHKFMSVIYLAIAYHSFILMKPNDWLTPLGLVMMVLIMIGVVSAIISLLGKVGSSKTAFGNISKLTHYKEAKTLAVTITPSTPWHGHIAGQFAFVTFDAKEGAHPFSFASDWGDEHVIKFAIKQIGDYVNSLPDALSMGDNVKVEGPYGNFNFNSEKSQQIWVAGGIGVVPFVSRLEELISNPDEVKPERHIDLFYTTRDEDKAFIEALTKHCQKAQVRLHIINTNNQPHLTGQDIEKSITEMTNTDLWICGPMRLGNSITSHFIKQGISHHDIHQELFDMR